MLNCQNYTVNNQGQLQIDMDKGEPRVFFPKEYMEGSGLCGYAASNASLASIKTGKNITSYASDATTVGARTTVSLTCLLAAVMSYVMIL
jgi:alpha-amylase